MPKRADIIGKEFSRLRVTEFKEINKHGQSVWVCACICGNIVTVRGSHLKSRSIQSCGCLRIERVKQKITKHGLTGTGTYVSWQAMLSRCYNSNNSSFFEYGGRGITVCDAWRFSFENFYSDMGERDYEASIERINTNGNYEPENCKWAYPEEQNVNTRHNHFLTFNKETLTISQWSRKTGLSQSIISDRIRVNKWSIEKTLTMPQFAKDEILCKRGHLLVEENIYVYTNRNTGYSTHTCKTCCKERNKVWYQKHKIKKESI